MPEPTRISETEWVPTLALRWFTERVSDRRDLFCAPVLQQQWRREVRFGMGGGIETQWRDVPTAIEP